MTSEHRPKGLLGLLSLAVVIGIISLLLSVQNAFDQRDASNQREQDRISSDLQACERGNVVRSQIKAGFTAVDESVNGVLDTFLGNVPPERAAAVAALRAKLQAPLSKLDKASETIQIIDCQKAVPGAADLKK